MSGRALGRFEAILRPSSDLTERIHFEVEKDFVLVNAEPKEEAGVDRSYKMVMDVDEDNNARPRVSGRFAKKKTGRKGPRPVLGAIDTNAAARDPGTNTDRHPKQRRIDLTWPWRAADQWGRGASDVRSPGRQSQHSCPTATGARRKCPI